MIQQNHPRTQEPPMHAHITQARTHHAPTPTQTTTPPTRHTHTHTKMTQIHANCLNSYEFCTKFVRISYEIRTKFVTTTFTVRIEGRNSYEIRTKFARNSYEIRTKFARISYEFRANFVRISQHFCRTLAEEPHQHHLCMYRSPHTHTHFPIPAPPHTHTVQQCTHMLYTHPLLRGSSPLYEIKSTPFAHGGPPEHLGDLQMWPLGTTPPHSFVGRPH